MNLFIIYPLIHQLYHKDTLYKNHQDVLYQSFDISFKNYFFIFIFYLDAMYFFMLGFSFSFHSSAPFRKPFYTNIPYLIYIAAALFYAMQSVFNINYGHYMEYILNYYLRKPLFDNGLSFRYIVLVMAFFFVLYFQIQIINVVNLKQLVDRKKLHPK